MAEKKGRILCVDDEPNILRSLSWLLQREFEVFTANGGEEGLALVAAHDFDVVISDQRMPGMMGSEFLREVRKLSPRSMRIMLTGYSDLQAMLRSVNDSEVFRFISKPWKIDELPAVVAEAASIARHHPEPDAVAGEASARASAAGVESLLLIDDEATLAEHLRQELGSALRVIHAQNIGEAVGAFAENDIGIVLSDTRVGDVDTTAMLRMLKQQHPGIVTVVYTAGTDAGEVVSLINQGQIFRFIPKPVKPAVLALAVTAAGRKRQQLKANPELAGRHVVVEIDADSKQAFSRNLDQVARQSIDPAAQLPFLQRISGGFKRLFGTAA
ncbi:MAG: response regulator [Betaproteobacteria bacterium HGW-Betaproteobacteria-7]|jgi:serine/threonine-protein kinase|nr:MAG: response regulator [Betaproteobacteria bacterium HGW-Betaproteobacteria-7]